MLMTAGLGTRLRPFTERVSKPMLPILSVPTAFYALDQMVLAGVKTCVSNLHAHSKQTQAGLLAYDGDINFKWSDESQKILGSWGGLVSARDLFKTDQFFWVNGDIVSNANLKSLGKAHLRLKRKYPKIEMTLLLRKSPRTGETYREIKVDRKSHLVVGFGERTHGTLYYASSAVVEKSSLSGFPKNKPLDFVSDYLSDAIARGAVGFHIDENDLWIDVGSPQLWAEAHFKIMTALEKNKLPKKWKDRLKKINVKIKSGIWASLKLQSNKNQSYKSPLYIDEKGQSWSEGKIVFSKMSVELPKK